MDRPRLIRGLRIAWTAIVGMLCVLVIGLWIRSISTFDRLGIALPGDKFLIVVSNAGQLSGLVVDTDDALECGWFDYGPLAPVYPDLADTSWPGRTFAGFGWISDAQYDYFPNYPVRTEWQQLNLRERSYTDYATGLIIPLWILFVPLVCLGTVCGFGFQVPPHFSLRTLLIATTLIAVVLGMAVWAAR